MKYIHVIVERPEHIPLDDAKEYIIKELASGGGCKRPDDPLFNGLKVFTIRPIRVSLK